MKRATASLGLLMMSVLAPVVCVAHTQSTVATTDQPSGPNREAESLLRRKVTVDLVAVPLKRAIQVVAAKAHVAVQYRSKMVDQNNRLVTLQAVELPLGTVLDQLFAGTKLRVVPLPPTQLVVVEGNTVQSVQIAGGSVSGVVVDSTTSTPLTGVAVSVLGTKLTTVTNSEGRFNLREVPTGDQVLVVRLLGYARTTRPVQIVEGQAVSMRIALKPAATVLSGVVTTATGVQQKREVGNDIVSLNVDSLKQIAPITSVTDLLESRVPGLTVLRSSGAPGDPARLRLRGSKSITGSNDPIVIVDGVRVYAAQSDKRTANLAGSAVQGTGAINAGLNVSYAAPSPLDQLDPNSIETVEVLKGPSASSLYGSDAANGVIVITTKKGRAGPARWSTTLAQGTSYLPGRYAIQTIRWGHGPYQGSYPQSQPCPISDIRFCSIFDSVTHIQVLNESRWSPFGRGNNSSGSASVSGGSAALTYALTGSVATELGYLKLPAAMAERFRQFHGYDAPGWAKRPSQYATWGGGGQLTALPTPGVTLTFQSNLFHSLQQRSSLEQQLPRLLSALDTVCGTGFSQTVCTPLSAQNAYERATSEQLTMTNALSGSWAPWVWLPLTATAGLNTSAGHDVALFSRDIVPYVPICSTNGQGISVCSDTLGRYGTAEKSAMQKTLTVNTTIPGWRGRLRTALGLNIYSQSSTDLDASEDTLGLGVSTPSTLRRPATQFAVSTTTYGWFFEPRFTLSERFFLTPGFRLDGGNANGQRAGVGALPGKLTFAALFPKVNFSWVALDRQSEEQPLFGALTLLRPRLAIGSAGVQPSPGDQLRLLTTPKVGSSDELVAVGGTDLLLLQTLGNTQLRPERSNEVEGGFETELWHGRVTLDLTHARQLRHDAIISVPVAASVDGLDRTLSLNIGEIRNTSTELSASVRPVEMPALTWSIGGNYARNDNRVLKLDPHSTALVQGEDRQTRTGSININESRIAVGYPLFGRWGTPIVSYYDANQDGVIQASEISYGDTVVYLGRQEPAYTAAFNTDLTLFRGRIGVHANLSRQGGYAQLNSAGKVGTFLSGANEVNAPLGEQAIYVSAATSANRYGLVQTVDEWRFQSLSVNYNAPTSLAQRLHSQRLSVALQGENLGLWTNYRGKDPNVNGYSNGNLTADLGQLAQPRTWRLQLTLGN